MFNSLSLFCLQFFTFISVSLTPMIFLAVCTAIKCLSASRANFMFSCLALWCSTKAALFSVSISFGFCCLQTFISLSNMLKPCLGCIVRPRVQMLDLVSPDCLFWLFLRTKLIYKVVLVFFS